METGPFKHHGFGDEAIARRDRGQSRCHMWSVADRPSACSIQANAAAATDESEKPRAVRYAGGLQRHVRDGRLPAASATPPRR